MRVCRIFLPLLFAAASACGRKSTSAAGVGAEPPKMKRDIALPVKVQTPERSDVEAVVQTTGTLESDRQVDVSAEIDGEIIQRVRDVGDTVGQGEDGEDPLLLCRLEDKELSFALREAEVSLKEAKGKVDELEFERKQAGQELEEAKVSLAQAQAELKRAENGVADGTISLEERETDAYARDVAKTKLSIAQLAFEKTAVSLELGKIAVEQAEVARDRAAYNKDKSALRSPVEGVVTFCAVRRGQQVKAGERLYSVADPKSLVVEARLPVREANKIHPADPATVLSNAADTTTTGKVLLVAPTVDKDSGTVLVRVRVAPAVGFKPGLYVTLRIVVDRKKDALVVPKRAVQRDEQQRTYLFVVRDGKAERIAVKTGYERGDMVEVVSGIKGDEQVVVEGQDTLTKGARVEIQSS